MLFLLSLFLLSLQSGIYGQDCGCSRTGISDGVDTGVRGCRLSSSKADKPSCFVTSSASCPRARPSRRHRGAFFVTCSVKAALLSAAETDDVASAILFRQRGADLNINTVVSQGSQERSFSLASYAAALGSFKVLEDLIINEDDPCDKDLHLLDALCTLSNATKCDSGSKERRSIKKLLEYLHLPKCPFDAIPVARAFRVGVPASCGQHPYFVSVRSSFGDGYVHRCGGALIYPDTVVTAAHCLDGSTGFFDPVLFIETYSRRDGFDDPCGIRHEIRKGIKTILHPKWTRPGPFSRTVGNGNDIALIKLNKPSNKSPIQISTKKKPFFKENLSFIGFGRSSAGGSFSNILQIQSIKASKTSICKRIYAPTGVANNILCIGGGDKDFCDGDDGGPLIRRSSSGDQLVGIAHLKHPSFGCGSNGVPGLYANVAKLKYWIKHQRKKKF